jgi:hypothetical protein
VKVWLGDHIQEYEAKGAIRFEGVHVSFRDFQDREIYVSGTFVVEGELESEAVRNSRLSKGAEESVRFQRIGGGKVEAR